MRRAPGSDGRSGPTGGRRRRWRARATRSGACARRAPRRRRREPEDALDQAVGTAEADAVAGLERIEHELERLQRVDDVGAGPVDGKRRLEQPVDVAQVEVDVLGQADPGHVLTGGERRADKRAHGGVDGPVVGGAGTRAAPDDAASESDHRRLELLDPPDVGRAGTHDPDCARAAALQGFRMVTIA
jgi:hypothetical protein